MAVEIVTTEITEVQQTSRLLTIADRFTKTSLRLLKSGYNWLTTPPEPPLTTPDESLKAVASIIGLALKPAFAIIDGFNPPDKKP